MLLTVTTEGGGSAGGCGHREGTQGYWVRNGMEWYVRHVLLMEEWYYPIQDSCLILFISGSCVNLFVCVSICLC